MHVVAALAEHARTLHAGGPGTDHEDRARIRRLLELLRVPAAPILFHRGGVLGADERRPADLPARNAHVAADALADVVEAAFLDLIGQEGVRNRGPGGADDVRLAGGNDLCHVVGAGHAADAEHRHVGDALHVLDPGLLVVGLVEARRARVLAPLGDVADVDVPKVDHPLLGRELDELEAVVADLDALGAVQRVDGEAGRHGAVVAHRLLHRSHGLEPEARPVLEAAAVLVGTLVVELGQELERQIAVRAVDVDDVEARALGANRGINIHLDQVLDVVFVSLARVGARFELGRDLARAPGYGAALHAGRMGSAVPHLDPGQRAMPVDFVTHVAEVDDIALVPDAGRDAMHVVGFRMDRGVLGADAAPAALGLHAAEGSLGARPFGTCAVAVGNLIEAIFHGLRADLNRLEQAVILRITRHRASPFSSSRRRSRPVWRLRPVCGEETAHGRSNDDVYSAG